MILLYFHFKLSSIGSEKDFNERIEGINIQKSKFSKKKNYSLHRGIEPLFPALLAGVFTTRPMKQLFF